MKQIGGWLWMAGAIAALLVVQTFRHDEPLASFDGFLNGARGLVPLGIAITIAGAGLLLGAAIHGMALDANWVQPGKISGRTAGTNPRGGWGIGFFRGILLWQGEFHEESGIPELKHSWRTGEWLRVHRYFRETLVLVGLPLLLIGAFVTAALLTDVTAVRLLLLLALAYASARLTFAVIRA